MLITLSYIVLAMTIYIQTFTIIDMNTDKPESDPYQSVEIVQVDEG